MPTIDLSNILNSFDYLIFPNLDLSTYISHDINNYVWLTSAGHRIQASGAGIATDKLRIPTSGTIHRIVMDLGADSSEDIVISDLNLDLSSFDFFWSGQPGAYSFWSNVSEGETHFILGGAV